MQREFSACGIFYKYDREKKKWLVAQHSQHKGWVFPKGLIGDHKLQETSQETAVREVTEETGITGKIIEKSKSFGSPRFARRLIGIQFWGQKRIHGFAFWGKKIFYE